MTGNYVFVRPGEKMYQVASNFTNYLELGVKGVTNHYLEAAIEGGEFIVNAHLLDHTRKLVCRVVNNFPEGHDCWREMTPAGYMIRNKSGALG